MFIFFYIKINLHNARLWAMLTIYRFLLSLFNFANIVSNSHTIVMPLLILMPLTFFSIKKAIRPDVPAYAWLRTWLN